MDSLIGCDELEIVMDGLRDQHSVERVFMD
jgi:hypothetical protein